MRASSSLARFSGEGLGVRQVQDDRLQERWGRHSCLPRADRNVCPTWQLNLGGPLQADTKLSKNEASVAGRASYHTRWPNFQLIFGPSFPSFRQLAAPWAKSYDGRRGPIASSTRCFAAAAARARNPKTMVSHTFSTHTFSTQRMLPSIFAFPFYLVC